MISSEPTAIGAAPAGTRPSDPVAGGMDVIPSITTAEAEGAIEMLYFFVGVGPGLGLTSSLLDGGVGPGLGLTSSLLDGGVGPRPKALAMRAANPGAFEGDVVGLFAGASAS